MLGVIPSHQPITMANFTEGELCCSWMSSCLDIKGNRVGHSVNHDQSLSLHTMSETDQSGQ